MKTIMSFSAQVTLPWTRRFAGRSSGGLKRYAAAAVAAAVALLGATYAAQGEAYTFNVSGSNITASGVITVGQSGPLGSYQINAISGTFTDTKNGISGAITGLDPAGLPTFNAPPSPPNTFGAPAFTNAGFSYDNLFWSAANSPAVCQDALVFFGGYFDVYGMAFNVAGGYTADLWSNGALGGYQLNDSYNGTPFTPNNLQGLAYAVNVSAAPTPEPGSLVLLGTGATGLAAFWRRRRTA